MRARANWRALLAEYRKNEPPSTELGLAEDEWRRSAAGEHRWTDAN
jgi:hypothetical protein